MAFKHRDKSQKTLSESDIDIKTEAFANKAERKVSPTYDKSQQLDLSTLSLDDLAIQYVVIDKQSNIIKGQILLEARERFSSNNEFGAWRSLNFNGRVTGQMATHLMNLARFFNDGRPLGNIPVSAGYLIAAPKLEDVADKVYERVIEITKPSLHDVKAIIHELKPDSEIEQGKDNIENELHYLGKMTKKQLIEFIKNNITHKQLKKIVNTFL